MTCAIVLLSACPAPAATPERRPAARAVSRPFDAAPSALAMVPPRGPTKAPKAPERAPLAAAAATSDGVVFVPFDSSVAPTLKCTRLTL